MNTRVTTLVISQIFIRASKNYEKMGLDLDSLHVLSQPHVSHPTRIGLIGKDQTFMTHLPHNSITTIEGEKPQEQMLKRHVFNKDQTVCSNFDKCSKLNSQHNQQHLHDHHSMNTRIVTLITNKIACIHPSIRAPRTTRKLAMASILITLIKHVALITVI